MKKISFLLLVLFTVVSLSGPAISYTYGAIYAENKVPVAAVDGGTIYNKIGIAKAISILGLMASGDASIKTAAANGNIKTIKHVNYDAKNILGVYGEYTTTVYGD